MALAPGTRFGPYEVVAPLGAGGMGEVHRARDTRLGREVALKILPPQFANDPERLARFEREAKALAALNHPRIAAIYGLEEFDGQRLLVMELALGTSLADRLARGPLPVRDALCIGRQIAEGIEAAHEKGILHRDLKPANIQVTDQGEVKILDFGLAKALAPLGAEAPGLQQDPADSPTFTARLRQGYGEAGTEMGVILGTAAYMSPEQARGRSVDKRTDIWAFGCVLYECLTGQRAFPGETVTDTLAAILEREPDWAALPAATPAHVRTLLLRCSRKDQRDRLRDIGDARIELADPTVSGETAVAPIAAVAPARPVWRHPLPIGLAIVMLVLGAGLTWSLARAPRATSPPPAVTRFTITLPPGQQLYSDGYTLAISPDGRELAYAVVERLSDSASASETVRLYRRRFDELASRPIPGTDFGSSPFFSPDGEWLGFVGLTDAKLKRVSLRGGAPQSLFSYGVGFSRGRWTNDDAIVFSTLTAARRMPSAGGEATTLLTSKQLDLEHGDIFLDSVCIAPDSSGLVATVQGLDIEQSNISVFARGSRRRLLSGAVALECPPMGQLLFVRPDKSGTMKFDCFAVPFDWGKLETAGRETPVLEGVTAGLFAVSASGVLAYASGDAAEPSERFLRVMPGGRSEAVGENVVVGSQGVLGPRVSPDGKRLLLAQGRDNASSRLLVMELATGRMQTIADAPTWWSAWAPDGRHVVYTHLVPGEPATNLYWKPADGSGVEERLTRSPHHQQPQFVSRDNRLVVYQEQTLETGFDLWVVPITGDRSPKPLVRTKANERMAALSPDGRYMAYASDESGREEVYVRPFPEGGGAIPVSSGGGTGPLWAPDGRTLFYRNSQGKALFAVPVTWEPAPAFGTAAVSQGWWIADVDYGRQYDIFPDGRHLLMLSSSQTAGSEITVVLNWFEELKRKMASK